MGPSHDNPMGFFENEKVVQINDEILELYGLKWHAQQLLPKDWMNHKEISILLIKAKDLIAEEFGSTDVFCIKDPRLSLTLPFWKKIMDDTDINYTSLILIRNPKEIALSLEKRNFFHHDKSYLLNSMYLLNAELHSRDHLRIFIQYDHLIQNPASVTQVLPLDLLNESSTDLSPEETNFIDPNLRTHQIINEGEHKDLSQYGALAHDIFNEIRKLGTSPLNDQAFRKELDSLQETFTRYVHLDHSDEEEHEINTKIMFDYGNGFREKNSNAFPVIDYKVNLNLDLSNKDPIVGLKILPVSSSCILTFTALQFEFRGGSIDYKISINSHSKHGDRFYFKTSYPQVLIKFESPAQIDQMTFGFVLEAVGKEAVEKALKRFVKGRQQNLFIRSLKTLLIHPFRFIQNLNVENFRTLRSALKRESPRQILRNFIKLLERPDTQKAIESRTAKRKSEILQNPVSSDKKVLINPALDPEVDNPIQCLELTVLYICSNLPEYDRSSGGRRATHILNLLSKSTALVIYSLSTVEDKYRLKFEQLGIKVVGASDKSSLVNMVSNVDVLVYSMYYTFWEVQSIAQMYRPARIIIDSVDIHWVREKRSIGIWEGINEKQYEKNKRKEIEAYAKADVTWVVSEPDKKALLGEVPNANAMIVSNIHRVDNQARQVSDTKNLLFFGGFNHYPNISAAQLLAREIFPKVLSREPEARLFIAGSNAPKEIATLDDLRNVHFLGFIEEEQIDELYAKSIVSVSPLLAGAGVKGKITESIHFMTPVVTNAIGNEGIDLIHGESGFIHEDFDKMADTIVEILHGKFDLKSIAENAFKKVQPFTDPAVARKNILKSLVRQVSVCIVTWNGIELLKECIDSILKNTYYPNFKILVYSNNCTDGTKEYLVELEKANSEIIVPFLTDQNDVFVIPNNRMMNRFPENDVVLLNNDTTVEPGWLTALVRAGRVDDRIGIAGAKVLYPDGRLQEFGSEIFEDGSGINHGKGDEQPFHPDYSKIKAAGYVSGCCFYIKRSTIDTIGLLSETFHPLYCEDSDYCYRAWEHDICTVVTPHCIVIHREGSTSGNHPQEGFKKYQEINLQKFLSLHKKNMGDVSTKIKTANKRLSRL